MTTSPPRVVVIDDHRMLADTIAFALEHQGIAEVNVIDPLATDASSQLVAAEPDACLIDLELGDDSSGGLVYLEAAIQAGVAGAMFTGCRDDARLGQCLENGAVGIISKELGFEQVIERVSRLLAKEPINTDTEILGWVLALQRQRKNRENVMGPFDSLTNREGVVLKHLMTGTKVDEIAEQEFVSVATVRSQVRSILQKLSVTSQIAAIAEAHRVGWGQ